MGYLGDVTDGESGQPRISLASVLLRVWRGTRGQEEVALLVGTKQGRYSQLERGVRKPGRSLAVSIERGTGGMVRVEAWDEPAPPDAVDKPPSSVGV